MRNFPVLKAVAYPPTMLFVPLELGALVLGVHVAVLLIGVAIFSLNPFIVLVSFIASWLVAMAWSMKEPHLVSLAKTINHPRLRRHTRNIVQSDGAKYVP